MVRKSEIDEHGTFLVRLGPECRALIERLNKKLMEEDEANGRPSPRGYSYGATVHQALLEALDHKN
jgi:hypothetical protein